jgi:hypothetical protein
MFDVRVRDCGGAHHARRIMRIESWAGAAALCGMLSVGAAGAPKECRRSTLPPNVEVLSDLHDVLQQIYDGSETFRAQCARIAAESNVRVRVRLSLSIPRMCRAFTVVRRQGRAIHADVHVPPGRNHAELVAHEFEHVLEQIDGLDLRRLSRTHGARVWEVERGWFESGRAIEAGRVVTAEVYRRVKPTESAPLRRMERVCD